jgi:hypothetical protein
MSLTYRYSQKRGALQDAAAAPASEVNLDVIDPDVLRLVHPSIAQVYNVLPISLDGETLTLASDKADDIALRDQLTFMLVRKIVLIPAPRSTLAAAIARHYGPAQEALRDIDADKMFVENTAAFGDHEPKAWRMMKSLGRNLVEFKRVMSTLEEKPVFPGQDASQPIGESGMLFYVVEEGQRVLVRHREGTLEIVAGPRRIWRCGKIFHPMQHFIAHPGEFLIVRYRDGKQEHLVGPTEIWLDPRIHQSITSENALQLSAKEAVVVYSKKPDAEVITRRLVFGPAQFVPQPGEWLHTFTWHASQGGHSGAVKIPKGLVFQKLWLMPDQMYHDVADVRTTDDAVVTIRLMIFFELIDIERMLETTHDPIGDFVNAATSDVVAFVGRFDFETFKKNVSQLNELDTYRQLTGRAGQCGYRINKVVYRGYGAPESLQKMQDEAIEARTKLQLQRATEQQAQDLENYKLDCQITRAIKRRSEQSSEVDHDLAMVHRRQDAERSQREAGQSSARQQRLLEAEQRLAMRQKQDAQVREHLAGLREMGVDLTAYLTQARADRVIELRGTSAGTHVHLDPSEGHHEGNGKD